MRTRIFLLFLLLFVAQARCVEPEDSTQTIVVVRTGEQLQAPHVLTYRVVEFIQQRGRWIYPDLGYYDTGRFNEQLWLAAGGAEIWHGRHALWTEELYAVQEAGSATQNQRMLMLWTQLDLHLSPRLTGQTIVYPTVPLDRAARWGFDTDRAKLEYKLTRNMKIGPGYSSTDCSGGNWQNRPFLTTTISTGSGSYEFWLERMAGGAQIQLRYQLALTSKKARKTIP